MISLDNSGIYNGTIQAGLEPYQLDQLFCKLAEIMTPDVILEIGSRDFIDALKIKASSPSSTVFAFEANPENFSEHLKNINEKIFPLPLALGEKNGIATIKVPKYASRGENASQQQRGIASILPRGELGEAIHYEVPMMTLESFMTGFSQDCSYFAMWIDVEGYAYQVVSGASRTLLEKCVFIKVEVEEIGYWENQHLSSDMRGFMLRNGFTEIANCDLGLKQYDILFVNDRAL
jgi:FkbM family methyltransferase